MNSVKVPTADFLAGTLPEVCARSGALAKNRYRVLAREPGGRPISGAIALHGSVASKISLLRLIGAFALAFSLASAVSAGALAIPLMFIVSVVSAIISAAALIGASRSGITARVVDGGEFIELSPIADGFKLAILVPGGGGCGNDCNCGKPAHDQCADEDSTSVNASAN